ncbi:sensor histidine kinase [Segetibacter sp. 3557_3]|uniref:sensor histidine kinase n=1 Tax=Segetibacter sp. 3557_3 TaxID=2547429 RepID=UPI0014049CC3|nr:ATP-binding protein [Segetibacter sp. 3557_3]
MNDNILYTTVLVSVFIAVILTYFFISIVRYHRRYVKLQREQINAEITIQENERKRIANDLHDSIGPMLSAVKMNINCIDTHSAADEQLIKKSGVYIDEIVTNLRRISYNLLPNALERKGLVEALTRYIEDLPASRLKIELNASPEVEIPSTEGVHIFRMLQEVIHNTIKHAMATSLKINILKANGVLEIITTDNGKGFKREVAWAGTTGLGLKSINSRIELLNGKLTIDSQPGRGTIYIFRIPV